MTIMFRKSSFAGRRRENAAVLSLDNWDDYSFKTSFSLTFYDEKGQEHRIGNLKLGYVNQQHGKTSDVLPDEFELLPETYFSLGQDVDYYQNLRKLPPEAANRILEGLRDVIYLPSLLGVAKEQTVFSTSLMRGVSESVILGQYHRVLAGEVVLTEFRFLYRYPGEAGRAAPIHLDFHVKPESKPSTNIHVLIGRNGIGKTTLLNNIVSSIVDERSTEASTGKIYSVGSFGTEVAISSEYFSSVVSVSFSAFDSFIPPIEQPDRSKGIAYFYIGLKTLITEKSIRKAYPKKIEDLRADFIASLKSCFAIDAKKSRWLTAILKLESDANFADMDLGRLAALTSEAVDGAATALFNKMSSGHAIVLLTMTKLVETVEEKTLVLMDEPESHLHPPLLSAFTRALAELLTNRNGVAIIATHSPVVVQEVPKSCVWKLFRSRTEGRSDRPELETFGENVGVLTREIFGLEVSKSGFHDVLSRAVEAGKSFEEIREEYGNQLGFEAQAVVRALIASRDLPQ